MATKVQKMYCSHCSVSCEVRRDPDGTVTCIDCGKVLGEDDFFDGPTFESTADGGARLSGNVLRSVQSEDRISRERTLQRGKDAMWEIVQQVRIEGAIVDEAHVFYRIAIEKQFTKGRKVQHVAAACLYIACRHKKKGFLLIDFSDYLKVNVYVLGAVFLQLCELLHLTKHSIVRKLIDPSLFMHRFTECLLGERNNRVRDTALRIIASMKRDWMVTGRKPSGLCGAALYIAALSEGHIYSKSDVVRVVHVCEATLTKRLIEFENTEPGCLTISEFLARASEFDGESNQNQLPRLGELLCKHKNDAVSHFSNGLCKKCYHKFVKVSGGLQGGSDPPAFQRAEQQRMERSETDRKNEEEAGFCSNLRSVATENAPLKSKEPESSECQAFDASPVNEPQDTSTAADEREDPESFSDIDDVEVDGYLLNEVEKHLKKIVWEELNKEYLEEEEAKKAAAAAAKEFREANLANCSEDMDSAQELAALTAAALAKSKKERKQRRAEEAKNSTPAQTPLEATCRMLKRKTYSKKVNFEALEALYTDNVKKPRTGDEDGQGMTEEDNEPFDSGAADLGDKGEAPGDYDTAAVDDDSGFFGEEGSVYDDEFY